ncbi:hypothetical protein B0H15DRAFT_346700 [Mycena belliarum]|uniref:Uncharacterized protein n=1 Tax=Mycena belliarum TaxID=1033014 RepID=A0AAD6U167_9AGAR|nr:hypothetical protein B0H15DRAFT_346700 [Mycena belliae]
MPNAQVRRLHGLNAKLWGETLQLKGERLKRILLGKQGFGSFVILKFLRTHSGKGGNPAPCPYTWISSLASSLVVHLYNPRHPTLVLQCLLQRRCSRQRLRSYGELLAAAISLVSLPQGPQIQTVSSALGFLAKPRIALGVCVLLLIMAHSGLLPQQFLLLIENSSVLAGFWADLRDCYLPRLVEQLSGSHPPTLTNIFSLESRPANDFQNPGVRQHGNLNEALKQLEFNYELDNSLSTAHIQSAVEFLSVTTAQARHLIVVAATPPLELVNGPLHDPWYELASAITQGDVHLHLALTSNLRSGALPHLFDQTLKWKQNIEEPLWLPKYSTAMIFRVSAQQGYSNSVLPDLKSGSTSCSAPRAPRDVIPSDMYTTKSLDEVSSESPSLVSQLQQFHGLTKKKVYGAKAPRVPFVGDERVRDRYRGTPPASFPIPPENSAPPLLARGSRLRCRTKADRAITSREREREVIDPYALRQWYKPTSSMDNNSEQSPYSSSSLSLPPSPVTPVSPVEGYAFASSSSLSSNLSLEQSLTQNTSHFYPPYAAATSTCPGASDSSQLRRAQASFHLDLGTMGFGRSSCEPFSTAPTSPPHILSPLSSPSYVPQAPSDSFDTAPRKYEASAQHYSQFQDEPGAFPFPMPDASSAYTAHVAAAISAVPGAFPYPTPQAQGAYAHVPAEGSRITAVPSAFPSPHLTRAPAPAQTPGRRAIAIPQVPWDARIKQPTPMHPFSGPELQDLMQDDTSPATKGPSGVFASSSSSLTGWAG